MTRSKTLLVAALALTVSCILAAVIVPGAVADRDEPVQPTHLEYRESNVRAADVTGESVTLAVESRIVHGMGPAENVTVVHRAVDEGSGILAETVRADLGTLDGEQEFTPVANLTVPRESAYDVQTTVYVDGRPETSGTQTVRGVGTLIPEYARTDVAFRTAPTTRTRIPPIAYTVEKASDETATLDVSPFVTNTGDESESDLELAVQARQADSNIVADTQSVDVGTIDPGRTVRPSVAIAVPDGYNYHLDAMLRRDGVTVAATSTPASLDPTEEMSANVTRRDVGLETSDFETDETRGERDRPTNEPATEGQSGAGFGALAALLALFCGTALYARRSR